MRTHLKILLLLLLSGLWLKGQAPAPSGFAAPYSTGYYRIGWIQTDSGFVDAVRDTTVRSKYAGLRFLWEHLGMDTSEWVFNGSRYVKTLNTEDTLFGRFLVTPTFLTNQSYLKNITGLITQGSGIVVSGAGTSTSPYSISATGGSGGDSAVNPGLFLRQNITGTTKLLFADTSVGTGFSGYYLRRIDTNSYITPTALSVGLSGKQNTITLGTTSQYFRGDLSLATFPSGSTNSNVGSGYRFAVPGTNNIKTFFCSGCTLDSTTNTNGITLTVTAGGSGTVTSIGQTVPTSFLSISGSPITTSGTLIIGLANAPANSWWGNNTGSSTTPAYYTATQVTADLNQFTTTLQGLVPASGGGTSNFLRADGTWGAPVGTIHTLTYTQLALTNTLSISGGNTQNFLTATHALAGLMDSASKAVVDSLRLRTYTWPTFPIYYVQGLSAVGTDSVKFGGSLGAFYQPDTLVTNGQPFMITGLPGEASLVTGDSALVLNAATKKMTLVPTSVFGGSGAVSSVSNSDGTLTITPTTGAVVGSLALGHANTWTVTQGFTNINFSGTFLPTVTASQDVGSGTLRFSHVFASNFLSAGDAVLGAGSGAKVRAQINGTDVFDVSSTGQAQLLNYLATSSFPVTAVGMLVFDASGNIGTQAISGGGSVTINGTTGSASGSTLTFAEATSTSNTALTIPASGTTVTFTYNPAWDFGDNSRSANNNFFWGSSIGNTTLTGVRNIGIGSSGSAAITSGNNNIGIGTNTNFLVTTATDDISIGYLSGTGDLTGGQNTAVGGQTLRNNTATQETAFGYGALTANTSGTANTGLGLQALTSNTTGLGNTGVGNQAAKNETTAQHTTAIGYLALTTLLTGNDNTGVGFGAWSGITDGVFNSAFGSLAGDFGIHNSYNTIGGYKSYALDTAGNGNVILGNYAASSGLGINHSIIIGDSALGSSFPVSIPSATRSQTNAILIGSYIGVVNTPANMAHYDSSVIIGYGSGMVESSTDTLGYDLVMIGYKDTTSRHDVIILGSKNNQVLNTSYGGGMNTAGMNAVNARVGDQLYNTDSVGPVFYNGSAWVKMFGSGSSGTSFTTVAFSTTSNANAGSFASPTLTLTAADGTNPGGISEIAQTMGSGVKTFTSDMVVHGAALGLGVNSVTHNLAFGSLALRLATGDDNLAIGFDAGANISTGTFNISIGPFAMLNTTTGAGNTAIGYQSLNGNGTGSDNTAIGVSAMHVSSSVSNSTAIGYQALTALTDGVNNFGIGYTVLQADTSGGNNFVLGNGSAVGLLSGSANTIIGNQAGNTLTTGGGNLLIGYKLDVASASTANTMNIGGIILGQGLSTSGGSGYLTGTAGIGVAATTSAMLTLPAGTTTVAPMTITPSSAVVLTTPVNGAIENNGTHLFYTAGGTRFQLDQQTGSGVTTVGTFDSQTPQANGSFISGTSIFEQSASGTVPGMVNTGTQTFAGGKIFTGNFTSLGSILGNSATPSIAAGTGAGTSPSVSITGTNICGIISVTPGTTPSGTGAVVVTVTYSASATTNNQPVVVLTPANAATALISGVTMVFVGSTGVSNFTINSGATALTATTAYKWNYLVLGY